MARDEVIAKLRAHRAELAAMKDRMLGEAVYAWS